MKNKQIKKIKASSESSESLLEKAQAEYNSEHYKNSIDIYKELLKRENKDTWREALADCYLQRAKQVASKSMLKEAIVLWGNYSQYTTNYKDNIDPYIGWLLETKNTSQLKKILKELSAPELDQKHAKLGAVLGLCLLSKYIDIEDALPQDSAFSMHLALARQAMDSYQQGNIEQTEKFLEKIPYRSAFKDFNILFKALILYPKSSTDAKALLDKISISSPYKKTATLLVLLNDKQAKIDNILSLNKEQSHFIFQEKGFSKEHLTLIETVTRKKDQLDDQEKFNIVLKYKNIFRLEELRNFYLWTISIYPHWNYSLKYIHQHINLFDYYRAKALHAENNNQPVDAFYFWNQVINIILEKDDNQDPDEREGIKISLIMRHLADMEIDDSNEMISWHIKSLKYDKNSKESYLKIIEYFKNKKQNKKEFEKWLHEALDIFPHELDFLFLAVKHSMQKNSFKKAASYAEIILKIDSVNTFAKQILLQCHIAHARKSVSTKKFHIAEREINLAKQILLDKKHKKYINFVEKLMFSMADKATVTSKEVNTALKALDQCQITEKFQLIIESRLLGISINKTKQDFPHFFDKSFKKYTPQEDHIKNFISKVNEYREFIEDKKLATAITELQPELKNFLASKHHTEETLLALCELTKELSYFDLLLQAANLGKKISEDLLFLYYQIYAESEGQPKKCSSESINKIIESILLDELNEFDELDDFDVPNEPQHPPSKGLLLLINFIKEYEKENFNKNAIYKNALDYDDDDEDDDDYAVIEDIIIGFASDFFELSDYEIDIIIDEINRALATPQSQIQLFNETFDFIISKAPKKKRFFDLKNQINSEIMQMFVIMYIADKLDMKVSKSIDEVINYFK